MHWSDKFRTVTWACGHENGVVVHGTAEPLLTVLDVTGVPVEDLLVIGLSPDCGTVVVESEERAKVIRQALEPAYAVQVQQDGEGDWCVAYDVRRPDGTARQHFTPEFDFNSGGPAAKDGGRASDDI